MKTFFTLITALIISMPSIAQYEYGEPVKSNSRSFNGGGEIRKMRFGLFIAPNNSWMKPTTSKSNDGSYSVSSQGSKIGYSWGLMLDKFFAENYGIATGLQLSTSGGIIKSEYDISKGAPTRGTVTKAEIDYKLQYFEVPFALKLMSDQLSGGIRIFGHLGVTAGINISRKGGYSVDYMDTANGALVSMNVSGENEKLRSGLSVTPILFQMNLGGGIEYQLTDKMSMYFGLFFNNGFAPDVTNPKEFDLGHEGQFTDGIVRLNNLSLKIGMFF